MENGKTLDSQQFNELTQGGACFLHHHPDDRTPTQEFLHGMQGVVSRRAVTSSYVALGSDDFIIADTSGGVTIQITLPKAVNSNEIEIIKPYGAGVVQILPSGSDTVLGAVGVSVSVANAALHFKSFDTDWKLI